MRGHRDVWRAGPDGTVGTEIRGHRLVVRLPDRAGGPVRFLVLRRDGEAGPPALIGSGTEPDVRTAMEKAARMADRLAGRPAPRRLTDPSSAPRRAPPPP